MHPIEKFDLWYNEELILNEARIPSACCLSSLGADGYPNSRFVSLKEIYKEQFIITGPLNSRKGLELLANPKSSLTFWWTKTERQVRIQGDAFPIKSELADQYFQERSKASQLVSSISHQGQSTENILALEELYQERLKECETIDIKRPQHWSGFGILPKRIELMEFKESRFHYRELYTLDNNNWVMTTLQP